jgi:uncharacterized protein YjbI with pentapeptide repeats
MNRVAEVALISAVTSVSVLAVAAVVRAALWIHRSVSHSPVRHDDGWVTGAVRTSRLPMALEVAQGRLLTFGTGLFAAGASTARNLAPSLGIFPVSQRGKVADRYAVAVEQLVSVKPDVRFDGIYALERLAHDSPADHPAVMEALAAFIREPPRAQSATAEGKRPARHPARMTPPDVQAAITVIGRRRPGYDRQLVDLDHAHLVRADLIRASLAYASLAYADLTGADLTGADLTGADLTGADLAGASLARARLTGAILRGADLTGANLTRADLAGEDFFGGGDRAGLFGADLTSANLTDALLRGVDLSGAILANADLTGAHLTGAILKGADLTRANLTRAKLITEDFTGARLFRANLPGANLTGANLTSADFTDAGVTGADLSGAGLFDADLVDVDLTGANLRGADLRGACWPPDAVIPAGWQRDADSGRLRRGGTGSCEAATP